LDRNILMGSGEHNAPKVYMDAWVESLVKGQDEVVRVVKENLREQKERHEARVRGEVVPEFPVGSYVLVEHVNNLRRGPRSKLLPFLKGPLKVVRVQQDRYTLLNLLTGKEKDYHARRLHEYHYDPQTLNPLLAACKDDGSIYPVESISRMRGNPGGRKDGLSFLVHWVGFETPTWEPWKNVRRSVALFQYLSNHQDERCRSLIPKNVSYQGLADSSDEEEGEEGTQN
jgi:hypothetical protein